MNNMDNLDRGILKLLQENSKISYKKIASIVKEPTSTIHFRVKRMIEEKIITKFSACVDLKKIGYNAIGWVGISVDPLKLKKAADILQSFEEVLIVVSSSGDHNIVIQVISKDEKSLWRFVIDNVQGIDGIKDFHVSTTLDVYKWNTNYGF